MKKLLLLALFLFMTNSYAADPIVGKWKTIDDATKQAKSIVQIYKRGVIYYGKIIKLLKDPQDKKCDKCKGSRKNKPVVGMVIVWNMKKDDDVYKGGKILDPENGKSYTCKMWVQGNKLKVRGYIAFFFRTQYWYRVK